MLLPKIAQWSEESSRQLPVAPAAGGQRRGRGESLIPLGRYSQLYAELKEKYGPTLVQVCCVMESILNVSCSRYIFNALFFRIGLKELILTSLSMKTSL